MRLINVHITVIETDTYFKQDRNDYGAINLTLLTCVSNINILM